MYATVRVYEASPDLADALAGRADDIKQLLRGIDGFEAYYLVKTDGGAVSVSVYDDKSGAEESNRVAAGWLRENMPDLPGTTPQISAGEVVVSS
jgi:hypothetical protein